METVSSAAGFINTESNLLEFDSYTSALFLHLTYSVVAQMAMRLGKLSLILERETLPLKLS
jgi:hypothetical protein